MGQQNQVGADPGQRMFRPEPNGNPTALQSVWSGHTAASNYFDLNFGGPGTGPTTPLQVP